MSKCSLEIFNYYKELNEKMIFNFYKYLFLLRINLIEINEYDRTLYDYFNYIYEIQNIDLPEARQLFLVFIKIIKSTLYYNDYRIFVNKKNTLREFKKIIPIKYGGSLLMKLLTIISSISMITSFSDGRIDDFIEREIHPTFNSDIDKLSSNYDGICVMNAMTVSIPTDKLIGEISEEIFQGYKKIIKALPEIPSDFDYTTSFRISDNRISTVSDIKDFFENIILNYKLNNKHDLLTSMISINNQKNDFNHRFNVFYNRDNQKIMLFDRNFQFPLDESSQYIFYEDGFFTYEQEILLENKITKIQNNNDILSYYLNLYKLTGNNYIAIENINDYDGVNFFSTCQEAIDNINNFHLIRDYVIYTDVEDINSVLRIPNHQSIFFGGAHPDLINILKSDIFYFIIYCLYKNNRFNENSIEFIDEYTNFINAIIYKNKIIYIKYLICLLLTNCNELLTISEKIINIDIKTMAMIIIPVSSPKQRIVDLFECFYSKFLSS
jgi:hypothetical protein